ncbi:MAG: hypothetical protein HC887_09035 [Desulfobacteraceae bacterium]|nr:hypothetical protein [Desulfobacteraceae bacterium]
MKSANLWKSRLSAKTIWTAFRKKAEKFLDILDEYEHRDFTLKIVNLLKSETPLDIRKSWFGEIRESQLKQDAIRKLLIFIRQQTISYSPPQSVNFAQLLQNVEIMMTGKAQGQSESFNFYLAGKDFSFNSRQIGDLMTRSSVTLLLREFIARSDQSDGLFFSGLMKNFPRFH